MSSLSKRGTSWLKFANKVLDHIEHYTVPQYGDMGKDIASEYTVQHCIDQSAKYGERVGRNSREGQDLLDRIKSAHYQQMAHDLIEAGEKPQTRQERIAKLQAEIEDLLIDEEIDNMENEIAEGRSLE
jgi:hypothetical protein